MMSSGPQRFFRKLIFNLIYTARRCNRTKYLPIVIILALFIAIASFTGFLDFSSSPYDSSLTTKIDNYKPDEPLNITLSLFTNPDHYDRTEGILVYPQPSNVTRPDTFPRKDSRHLHGLIGVKLDTGTPVWSPKEIKLRMSKEEKRKAHEGFAFNTRTSESLTLDRDVPDYNSKQCQNVQHDYKNLPKADIVMTFHNEHLPTLLRSIHSILNRTPPELLGSIILVNDDSNIETHPWLFDELYWHLNFIPKTRLVYLTTRRGLMMARIVGSKYGDSPIIVYLDSHIECAPGWLEPMIENIHRNRTMIVTPFIHTIDADNFAFESGRLEAIGFHWGLGQTHMGIHSDFEPKPSPVMAGGLFAVNRDWWLRDLEGYDSEMRLYGGEEMEIGFRAWQCGGSIYVVPCSRVGHVFRTPKFWQGQVYPVPYEEIARNKRRAAVAWMGEYSKFALTIIAELPSYLKLGSVDNIKKVQDKLKCKPFDWYLKNVFPSLFVPPLDSKHMPIISKHSNLCFDTYGLTGRGDLGVYPCHGQHGSQMFLVDQVKGSIFILMSNEGICVRVDKPSKPIQTNVKLHFDEPAQACSEVLSWRFDPISGASDNAYLLKVKFKEDDHKGKEQKEWCLGLMSKTEWKLFQLNSNCPTDDLAFQWEYE